MTIDAYLRFTIKYSMGTRENDKKNYDNYTKNHKLPTDEIWNGQEVA